MQYNVGKTDQLLRIIAGAAIILVGIYFQNWWSAIGIVPIATGLLRWCPAYVPFRIKTN